MATNMVLVKNGKIQALLYLFRSNLVDAYVGLFLNDPGVITDDCDYGPGTGNIQECTFDGYAQIQLTGTPPIGLNVNREGEIDEPTFTWTRATTGTPQTAYGVFVSAVPPGMAGTALFFVQKFPIPQTVTNAGDKVECRVNLLSYQHNKIP